MTSKAEALIELAAAEFELTEPEQKLLRAMAAGEAADYRDEDEALNDPARAEEWGEERCLRASVVAWLCTDKEACKHMPYRGLRVAGAKIILGKLDLQFAHLEFPFIFHQCTFPESIDLTNARVRFLDLSGSSVGTHREKATPRALAINAGGLQVESDIRLGTGFHAIGGVELSGATIGGNLSCSKGRFDGQGGNALSAENAEVKGEVFLRNQFHAIGCVWLSGITIGGTLDCNNGQFEGKNGDALNAVSSEVKGSVFLCNGFHAIGCVWLSSITISGNLDCNNGRFDGQGGNALNTQSAEVKGFVLLSDDFHAIGCTWLSGITIGGNLECDKGRFDGQGGNALNAENAEVKGSVHLRNDFHAIGCVWLSGITIGSLDCDKGRFEGQDGDALIAQNAEVKGSVFLSYGFHATGRVWLLGITIGGNLDCQNGRFDGQGGNALIAENAEVKGRVFLSDDFHATGLVSLLGITIGGNLNCNDGRFERKNGVALVAAGTDIKGNVLMNRIRGAGLISFNDANIEDGFYIQGRDNYFKFNPRFLLICTDRAPPVFVVLLWCQIEIFQRASDQLILDLQFASVGTLCDSEASWPQPGNLRLDGFTYGKIHPNAPLSSRQRLKWLQLQDQKRFFSPQPYEQLARVLQASGREEDATAILIGKQEDLRKYAELSHVDRFWNWFLGKTIAHGYKSTRALWASLVIVGLGIIPFHFGYRFGLVEPSDLEAYTIANPNLTDSLQLPTPLPDNNAQAAEALVYPEFFSPTYSLDVFLPIIDFHQAQYWMPKASRGSTLFTLEFLMLEVRWGGVLLAYFWLHIFLGWIFTSLWVAGFTGLVRHLE